MPRTIGPQRCACDLRQLLAGLDVFDDRFVQAGEVAVPLFEHGLRVITDKPHQINEVTEAEVLAAAPGGRREGLHS